MLECRIGILNIGGERRLWDSLMRTDRRQRSFEQKSLNSEDYFLHLSCAGTRIREQHGARIWNLADLRKRSWINVLQEEVGV